MLVLVCVVAGDSPALVMPAESAVQVPDCSESTAEVPGQDRPAGESPATTRVQRVEEYSGAALVAELHPDRFAVERQHMVETQLRARGIRDQRLLDAMASVPRHEFVEARYRDQAYEDHPLPIAAGQTISQPYIVALMLELLQLDPSSKVLEIGTGSGYQTAVLTQACQACLLGGTSCRNWRGRRRTLCPGSGLTNVTVVTGDGSRGLAEHAPFDAIVVSAAAAQIPPALFEQLREGGRMIIPVGPPEAQELQLVRKQGGKALISSAGRVPVCAVDQRVGSSLSNFKIKFKPSTAARRSVRPHRLCFTILVCHCFAICALLWR